jgi:hypothetical protein
MAELAVSTSLLTTKIMATGRRWPRLMQPKGESEPNKAK